MNERTPLVSIIIPVYNGSNYVAEAIDSALAQTYQNIEIIVVNDGSKDDGATEKIALSYGDKIRYFYKENGGVSSALNLGIEKMQGEYFSWLSHDDMYAPRKIESQIEEIKKYSEENLIALSASRQIDKDSNFLSDVKGKNRFESGRIISWQESIFNLLNKGSFNGCALLIPRVVFEKVGKFDEKLRYCQDLLMWLNIFINKFSLVFCEEATTYGRVHNAQLTQTGRALYHSDSEYMGDLLIPKFAEISDRKTNFLFAFAKHNAVYNNKVVVKKCLCVAKSQEMCGLIDIVKLKLTLLYGEIRPFIRRLYYKTFKRVKTQ